MSTPQSAIDPLPPAFQSLDVSAQATCSPVEIDLIWHAISGELPADERRIVVERVASDPAWAEAWRLAADLWHAAEQSRRDAAARSGLIRRGMWLATAAAVVIGAGLGGLMWRTPPPANVFRDHTSFLVESRLAPDTALARSDFHLRWTPGPTGARYQFRATTEDLRIVATAVDLTAPEFVITPDRLTDVAVGTRIFWQVDVTWPDGGQASSTTFVTRVR